MTFWLGTHMPNWLTEAKVPLFLSAIRLRKRRTLPKAAAPWALDSGGFSELAKHGWWSVGPRQYAGEVRRWQEAGNLQWAAIQDWMCEPEMIAKTGRTVRYHQVRTLASWFDLTALAPEIPWVPVLQGFRYDDYFEHAAQYEHNGVRLGRLPLVGIGSVCRRQDTSEAEEIIRDLKHKLGIRLHGFGFKLKGLLNCARDLESADSLAWSFTARRRKEKLPGCSHSNCNSCLLYALRWRKRVLREIEKGKRLDRQLTLSF